MSYGSIALTQFATSAVAPGAPTFDSIEQIEKKHVRVTVGIPSKNADGGPLVGLTRLTVVTIAMTGNTNPLEGLSVSEMKSLGVSIDIDLVDGDAGTRKVIELPIVNLGGFQGFAAVCTDG